jgi:hypothetical protein
MPGKANNMECGQMKPKLHAINRLYELLEEYVDVVNSAPLTENSKRDYITFADFFVRWADNDFQPGKRIRRG